MDDIPRMVPAAIRRKVKGHGHQQPRVPAPVFDGLGVSEAERRCAEEFYFDGGKAPWEVSGEEAGR